MAHVVDPGAWLRERLATDGHIHSSWSDGTNDPGANLRASVAAGLTDIAMTDHVRSSTTWLPDYVSAVRDLRDGGLPAVRIGVEAKMLDARGTLDLPTALEGIELVLIADHQYPTTDGPVAPAVMAAGLQAGHISARDVGRGLVAAMIAAIGRVDRPAVLAHPFSILPKMGLSEADIPDEALRDLVSRCRDMGTAVEVNEKWRCPGVTVARVLHDGGVDLVAGSDAHRSDAVGDYHYVREVLMAVAGLPVPA